jgi:peptidoglycan/LPS O-acetylase OafA/YrhL
MPPVAPASHPAAPAPRFLALDALRAVAALLVVWTHVCEEFVKFPFAAAHGGELHDLAWTFDFGRAGVVAFFATSGFLVPTGLKGDTTAAIRAFVRRRFFRLYPAYWLSVALAWVVLWWMQDRTVSAGTLLANLTMLPGTLGSERLLGLYWTLETELLFYALCIVLHVAGVLSSARWLFGLAAALLTGFLAFFAQNYLRVPLGMGLSHDQALVLIHLSVMLGGALARKVYDGAAPGPWPRVALGTLVLALLSGFVAPALALGYHVHPDPMVVRFGAPYGLGVALFALACACRWPVPRALARLGEASYSLYLLHAVVLWLTLWFVKGPHGAPLREFPLPVYLLALGALSSLVALVLYRSVEQPSLRLGAPGPGTSPTAA